MDPFPAWSGKNSRRFRRNSKGGALHRKGERNSRVVPPFPWPPDVSVHSRETCFPCTASTFKPRIDSHHGGTWVSPVRKPHGKATRGSHRSLDPLEGKRDTAATAREESARACPHSRRGLTPLGRLQKYPKIHVSTGEESSGSGTDSTQDLRPRHRRERNSERPPSNLHGDWPFLSPPERVPEVPAVSREHLPKLEKIQEVLPSRRDEAPFRSGVSMLITPNLWNFRRVLHTVAVTQEVPRHTRLHPSGSTRVPPTSRRAPFPPPSSRVGILSLRGRERIPGVPDASQEEALSTGKGRGTPGSCHHSQSPPDVSVHSRDTCFPALPRLSSRGSTHNTVARKTTLWKASWESLVGKPRGKDTDPLINAKVSVTLLLQLGRK